MTALNPSAWPTWRPARPSFAGRDDGARASSRLRFGAFAAVGELDDRHRRGVAVAGADLDDAGVAAGAVAEAVGHVLEELGDDAAAANEGGAWRRACRVPRLPRVIMRSTTRRSSLALASVVCRCSCSSNEVTMLRKRALRCELVRLSFRPLLRCLMAVPGWWLRIVGCERLPSRAPGRTRQRTTRQPRNLS